MKQRATIFFERLTRGGDLYMKRTLFCHFCFAAVFCSTAYICACSHFSKTSLTPEESLRKRVAAYWETLIAGDLEEAFKFIEPKGQKIQNRSRFITGMGNFIFFSYKIEDINLEGDRASVSVKRTFKIQPGSIPLEMKEPVSQILADPWVRINDIWYAAYEKPKPPFFKDPKRLQITPSPLKP
jgi:hypothetical protein